MFICIVLLLHLAEFDYTHLAINITFYPGGEETYCTNITVLEDQRIEDTETFLLVLTSHDSGARPQDPNTCVVLLVDSNGTCDVRNCQAKP